MRNINPFGLFDEENLLNKLSTLGDPLEKLDKYINWQPFKDLIESVFADEAKNP